jgi:hypothetical protein
MPLSPAVSRNISKLYNERIKWLMGAQQFGRRVKYIFPPKKIECPNCLRSGSGASSGRYKAGGPEPFENTTCPVCLGKGGFEEQHEEDGVLIVLFDANQWFEPGKVASLPDNSAMIIGDRLTDWVKVTKCERMILNTDVYSIRTPYVRHGEPYPVGLFSSNDQSGGRWFYCYMQREGGG